MEISFRSRIIVPVLIVSLIVTSLSSYISSNLMAKELKEEYVLKGITLATTLAAATQDALVSRDTSTIQGFIDQFRKVKGVGYIYIIDENGQVLAHTFAPVFPRELVHDSTKNLIGTQVVTKTVSFNNVENMDVEAPILAGLSGYVHVGIDMNYLKSITQNAFISSFLLVLIITFVSILILAWVVEGPIAQIKNLSDKARAFAEGKTVEIQINDLNVKEVKSLAISLRYLIQKVTGHYDDLVAAVNQRTEELKSANQQLIQSSKMSALGEMAGGIAHEINNPLAIIVGKVDHAKRIINSPIYTKEKTVEHLDKIEQMATRISKIVKGLRSFSRNGENDEMVEVSIKNIVEETLDLCIEKIKNNGVTLDIDVSSEVYVKCRSIQISQVFLNLLSNSIDAITGREEKWIKISTQVMEESVVVRFTDSGPGIPKDITNKLMQPFFTTKEVGKVTGLGLSISKGIIEAHKGRLYYDVSSRNTSFVIELPKSVQADEWAIPDFSSDAA